MGGIESRPCTLTKTEINEYISYSQFASYEVRALWHHFMVMSNNNDKMSRSQFQAAMLFKDSVLLDRLFRVFDKNDDDTISFSEFISCVSKLSTKASESEKLQFSFDIYDFDGDGFIGVSDLTSLLAAGLREHGIVISRTSLDEIVMRTMEEAKPTNSGFISFNEYVAVVSTHPQILAHMTLNVSGIIAKYAESNGVSFATPR